MTRPRRLIWLVPLAAAIGAGSYLRLHFRRSGPLVTLAFEDAAGIRVGDTPVVYRGVPIGKVARVALAADRRRALVSVRLTRDHSDFAQEGAAFWIVRPQVSQAGLGGLNALFSGPSIEGMPGDGNVKKEFRGLDKPPLAAGPGLRLALSMPRAQGLQPNAPVRYRGLQVGVVRDVILSKTGDGAEARIVVWRGYEPLVHARTRFWLMRGLDVRGGLFSGLKVQLESLKELMSGGVEFATPDKDMGPRARDGARFSLADRPKDEWLKWTPRIPISPSGASETRGERLPTAQDLMESKLGSR